MRAESGCHAAASTRDNWYETSFREDYLLVYRHRDEAAAERELGALLDFLSLPPGSRVLDACCGTGRHSVVLARRGYCVVGVDLSEVLLTRARAKTSGLPVRFVRQDVRKLDVGGDYDAVFNLFTSFGYFSDADNQRALCRMARALRPGGIFVLDYLNPAYVRDTLVPHSVRTVDGARIEETRTIVDAPVPRVEKAIVVTDARGTRTYRESVRLYTPEEMARLFQNAGLRIRHWFGDYTLAPYEEAASPRMIVVAERMGSGVPVGGGGAGRDEGERGGNGS